MSKVGFILELGKKPWVIFPGLAFFGYYFELHKSSATRDMVCDDFEQWDALQLPTEKKMNGNHPGSTP